MTECACCCSVIVRRQSCIQIARSLSSFIGARYGTAGEGAGGGVAQGKREVPVAPRVLAEAAEAAMHGGDNEWARREAVADLLAADIVYNTMDGKRVLGRDSVIDKMNDTMVRRVRRWFDGDRDGDGVDGDRVDGEAGEKNVQNDEHRAVSPPFSSSPSHAPVPSTVSH